MLRLFLFVLFAALNIGLAYIDAHKIKQNKPINHGVNALLYLIPLIIVSLFIQSWTVPVGLLVIRIPVFNTSLNYFRGLSLDYLSVSTTSVIDRITNWLPRAIGYANYHVALLIIAALLIAL